MPTKTKKDIFDVMFQQPSLTMRQAYWKVNGAKIAMRWGLLIIAIIAALFIFLR